MKATGEADPHEGTLRPWRRPRIGAAVGGALIAFSAWVHLQRFAVPFAWDSLVFLTVGKFFSGELIPYRDFWEIKPPAIFFYLRAVFAVLGASAAHVRLADWAAFALSGLAFFGVARADAGWAFAGLGSALWLYFAPHVAFNLGGLYTSQHAAIWAIVALWLAARYRAGGGMWAAGAAGAAAAVAALFKHPGAAVFGPVLLLIAARRSPPAVAACLGGAALPVVLGVAYFAWHGALAAFLDCNLWSLRRYGALGQPIGTAWFWERVEALRTHLTGHARSFPILAYATVVGVPVCLLRPTLLRVAALLWLALDVTAIGVQGRYAAHYFIQLFPSLFLVGALGAAWWFVPRRGERRALRMARLATVALLGALAWPRLAPVLARDHVNARRGWEVLRAEAWRANPATGYEDRIGAYLAARTAADERILVHGWGPSVIGIYWAAGRAPATRFFAWDGTMHWLQDDYVAAAARALPTYIVIGEQRNETILAPLLQEHYTLEKTESEVYPVQLWRRRARVEPGHAGRPASRRGPTWNSLPSCDTGGTLMKCVGAGE
jgi:hypothetical protein